MSSGFEVAGAVLWGTSRAVEAYVEALGRLAEARMGAGDPLALFWRAEQNLFYGSQVISLDPWLQDAAGREQVANLFEAAAARLLSEDVFTDYGRKWVAITITALEAKAPASEKVQ